MAEELADTHAAESAEIASTSGGDIGRDTSPPERLSLRETLNKSVEEVREKERIERTRDEQGKFAKEQIKPAAEKVAPAKSPAEGETPVPAEGQTPPKTSGLRRAGLKPPKNSTIPCLPIILSDRILRSGKMKSPMGSKPIRRRPSSTTPSSRC